MKKLMKKLLAGITCVTLAMSGVLAMPTGVYAAEKIPAMKSSKFTLVAGSAAKAYKATAATLKKFTVYKASIEKVGGVKVANIAVLKNKNGIRIRALEKNNTQNVTTTVRVRFWSIAQKKKTKAYTYPLVIKPSSTAKSDDTSGTPSTDTPSDTPTTTTPGISSVEQIAANKVKVTLGEAVAGLTTENFSVVESSNSNNNMFISKVEASSDNKVYTIEVAGPFTNSVSYTVYENKTNTSKNFAAVIGEAKSGKLLTTTAAANKEVTINYALYDKVNCEGIDVTANTNVNSTVSINLLEGDYLSYDFNPSSPKIRFSDVGQSVTLEFNYVSEDGKTTFTFKGKITCQDTSKVSTTGVFYKAPSDDADYINQNSSAAKFYLGLKDSTINVPYSGSSAKVYFYAPYEDAAEGAVEFESFEAKTASENIASAYISGNGSGKFAEIEVQGNNLGSTTLTVSAVRNNKTYNFSIPVKVYDDMKATKLEVETTRTSMTNAYDDEYYGVLSVKAYNAAGDLIGTEIENVDVDANISGSRVPMQIDEQNGHYTAAGASSGSHSFKVTAYGLTVTKNVTVTDVLTTIEKSHNNSNGMKVNYKVELSETALVLADLKKDSKITTTARLYATTGSNFVGYVRADGTIGSGSGDDEVIASSDTKIYSGVTIYAKKGNAQYGESLVDQVSNPTTLTGGSLCEMTFSMVDTGNRVTYSSSDSSCCSGAAAAGNYTVDFVYAKGNSINQKASASFSVAYKLTMPTVTVTATSVSSLSSIKDEGLVCNVDLNNNSGGYASITELYSKYNVVAAPTATNSRKEYVKYAGVTDTRAGVSIEFYVSVGQTFRES